MNGTMDHLFTIGDLSRDPRLESCSRRQIEYAIREARIEPVGRLGIIRAFSESQIDLILAALRKTARRGHTVTGRTSSDEA